MGILLITEWRQLDCSGEQATDDSVSACSALKTSPISQSAVSMLPMWASNMFVFVPLGAPMQPWLPGASSLWWLN